LGISSGDCGDNVCRKALALIAKEMLCLHENKSSATTLINRITIPSIHTPARTAPTARNTWNPGDRLNVFIDIVVIVMIPLLNVNDETEDEVTAIEKTDETE
jgi:hypothetical protein